MSETGTRTDTKPHKSQAMLSYKGVLDSEELHTLSSKLLAKMENNLNSPRGRFPSDRFLSDVGARLDLIIF